MKAKLSSEQAQKLQSIIDGLERFKRLNESDMELVARILKATLYFMKDLTKESQNDTN